MSIEVRTRLFIAIVAAGAMLAVAAAAWFWPIAASTPPAWTIAIALGLVILAGRFPIRFAKQADASLIAVPIFMAALLMHPTWAIGVAVAGSVIAETLLRAPLKVMAFNTGVNSLAAAAGAMTFFAIRPGGFSPVLAPQEMLPAAVAALALLSANLALVDIMVTIRKGFVFWKRWKETFAFEALQEGGLLSVGLIGAILVTQAWWGPIIVIIPAVLAYFGFNRIVSEASQKTLLADDLQKSLTQLKELQAQLIQSAKMASIGSLATGIAHEINNPVFAISGRADLLIKGASKHLKSDKALEHLHGIQDMAFRISSITRHLMEYSEPSAAKAGVGLDEIMDDALALMGDEAGRVKIVKDYHAAPIVSVVPSQLQQVFANLIANAIEASPEWGSVTLGCDVADGMAVAYVKDTGVGIPDEIKERLFEPFVTTKDISSRVGMGLGLYASHRIVAAHQGSISIESERGKGTIAWVRLPLAASAEESAQAAIGAQA